MIKAFNFTIKSLTELVAAKAALAQHGIGFDEMLERVATRQLESGGSINIGNYSGHPSRSGKALDAISYHGYRRGAYGKAVGLPDLCSLIVFLESGGHIISEEKEYVIVQTRTRTVRIMAKDAAEAMGKVRGGAGYHVSETFDFQFRDEN